MKLKKLANNAINFGIYRVIEIVGLVILLTGIFLLISFLCGKIKLGSSGEKVVRETNKRRPIVTRAIPTVSIILFMPKLIVLLANFLNSINK